MLERIYISYRDFDDETFDINDFKVEDEEKYNILLNQSFEFEVKDSNEEDVMVDYTNTLGEIVSAYAKIKDIKLILDTISKSKVKDDEIFKAFENSAKDAARNIYYRCSDLHILETTTELKNIKKRYELNKQKSSISNENATPTYSSKIDKESIQRAIAVGEKHTNMISSKDTRSKNFLNVFFRNRDYRKNSARLLKICSDLIEKYQKQRIKQSCKFDLIELVKLRLQSARAEVADWKDCDTNYIQIAHTMLAHATFDLLSTGKYHIYRGILNPMSCAENLMDVYKACMEYAVSNSFIDEETQKEQYQYLLECISKVG